jgi:GNAT superfamily N-acetyltransferase
LGIIQISFFAIANEYQDTKSLEIECIYVLQDYHGKQVGQLFLEKAISIANNISCDYVWLGVWEEINEALNFTLKTDLRILTNMYLSLAVATAKLSSNATF